MFSEVSEHLLQRAKLGEEAAWQELIDLVSPLVMKIIRNQIRQVNQHEDLYQEVLSKIFLKLTQYQSKQEFSHWVSRLTINTCYDWLRRQKVRPLVNYTDLGQGQLEMIEKTLTGAPLDDQEGLSDLRELLNRLIATLHPREQIVIRLLDLEELSVHEVCELTGWGASKVKVTAMRARKKLSEQFKKIDPNF